MPEISSHRTPLAWRKGPQKAEANPLQPRAAPRNIPGPFRPARIRSPTRRPKAAGNEPALAGAAFGSAGAALGLMPDAPLTDGCAKSARSGCCFPEACSVRPSSDGFDGPPGELTTGGLIGAEGLGAGAACFCPTRPARSRSIPEATRMPMPSVRPSFTGSILKSLPARPIRIALARHQK